MSHIDMCWHVHNADANVVLVAVPPSQPSMYISPQPAGGGVHALCCRDKLNLMGECRLTMRLAQFPGRNSLGNHSQTAACDTPTWVAARDPTALGRRAAHQ